MDIRAEKIAKARQKLKDHQKKITAVQKEECVRNLSVKNHEIQDINASVLNDSVSTNSKEYLEINEKDPSKETNSNNIGKSNDVNVTEILISTKTNLELQNKNLTDKLTHLESLYSLESSGYNNAKQKVVALERELSNISNKYAVAVQDISLKDGGLSELKKVIHKIKDENNNLIEQLEFTKSMLTTKESENAQLQNKMYSYQNQLEVLQLQVQQLTNNSTVNPDEKCKKSEETEALMIKISNLEQTIETLQKEKEQTNSHYEHYVKEINAQLKSELIKNQNNAQEIQKLCNRENSLIEQISDLEIRLQNYNIKKEDTINNQGKDMKMEKQYQEVQAELMDMNAKYKELQGLYTESLAKIQEINQGKVTECNHNNFSIDKLNADIASDKIAAQRATEQNKKLKSDVEDLEQVIVKMGKDKLELTEMWTHEKQLNKGLALKLAEVEEYVRNLLKQLKAKDEEMIRLQNTNRELEKKLESVEHIEQTQEKESSEKLCNCDTVGTTCHDHNDNHEETSHVTTSEMPLIKMKSSLVTLDAHSDKIIPKEDAMTKLQERFLNIMDQVANLSDEKHRLEHIILQLQNETDTICEYVALYQQQRSLLKKREEERSNQLKIYQMECDKLKRHLEELRGLLLGFAADNELELFLKEEQRHDKLIRVKELLDNLQNCSLINPKFKNFDLNIFYPCSCCSGQIIDI